MSKASDNGFKAGRFSDLDATEEKSEYVTYLEDTGARLRELSRARYDLLNLSPGDQVIDVGCGLGDDARELAALVGPRGKVIAIDSSADMIAQARRRSDGLGPAVEFAVGDAHELKFADASFTACWSERVLEHLADPARAITQMVRVIKPGGRLVAFEPDHTTLVIDAADRATTRAMVMALADDIRSSWIGRSLFGLFKANGLDDIRIIPTPIMSHSLPDTNALLRLDATAKAAVERGLIGAQAVSEWFTDLNQRHSSGRFFGCLLCFAAVGRKS
ncbi:MAG TPA: methyltransferase domain-containing protein [Candidatus Binataceae bacterium]|jgi:ubiquinone/menaquinone biosynthesis C-methylase UbiE|nr:methyltransferase domain-containing protein [Candidatus Binataceae bacterium]